MMGLTFKSMTVKLHDTESKHQGQGQGQGTKTYSVQVCLIVCKIGFSAFKTFVPN